MLTERAMLEDVPPSDSCSDRCEESVAEICFVQLGEASGPRVE